MAFVTEIIAKHVLQTILMLIILMMNHLNPIDVPQLRWVYPRNGRCLVPKVVINIFILTGRIVTKMKR